MARHWQAVERDLINIAEAFWVKREWHRRDPRQQYSIRQEKDGLFTLYARPQLSTEGTK